MASPNMNLTIPSVGVTGGAIAAANLVTDLNLVDAHDHTPGNGVLLTPSSLNINADLSLQSNNLTAVNTVRFTNLSAAITSASPNIGCIYEVNGDLYFNDTSGNQIKITSAGSVNAGAGSIGGLPSGTANVTYASSTYTFQSATNTAGNIDGRNLVLRNSGAGSFGMSLIAPTLAADTSLTLPARPGSSVAAVGRFITLTSAGTFNSTLDVDNVTLQISGTTLAVPTSGISTAQIGAQQVTAAKILNATITNAQIASNTISTGNLGDLQVTNAKVADATLTNAKFATVIIGADTLNPGTGTSVAFGSVNLNLTANRPAFVNFQAIGVSSLQYGSGSPHMYVTVDNGIGNVTEFVFDSASWGVLTMPTTVPVQSLNCVFVPASSASHTVTVAVDGGGVAGILGSGVVMYVTQV